MFDKLLGLFRKVEEKEEETWVGEITDPVELHPVEQEPFVSFPCSECEYRMEIFEHIMPGQAAVMNCDNCETSWTFFAPQLIIRRTKDIPEEAQTKIWGELSQ